MGIYDRLKSWIDTIAPLEDEPFDGDRLTLEANEIAPDPKEQLSILQQVIGDHFEKITRYNDQIQTSEKRIAYMTEQFNKAVEISEARLQELRIVRDAHKMTYDQLTRSEVKKLENDHASESEPLTFGE